MKKLNHKKLILISLFLTLVFLAFSYVFFYEKEFHVHTDFKVYLDSSFYNFSKDEYMSVAGDYKHQFVHIHDGDGEVIHFHKKGYSLVDFFDSLNISLDENCIDFGDGCDFTKELKFYVNGKEKSILDYKPRDLDRLLIVYSSRKDLRIDDLFSNVTDRACIQSGKCPERGDPFDESSCGPDSCIIDLS